MSPDPAAAASPATLEDATIGIVVSDWHSELTSVMLESVVTELRHLGVENEDIFIAHVPSVMELVFAARQMAVVQEPKAVVMLGCCTEDEDPQYQGASQHVRQGFTDLNLRSDIPYINGVFLTPTLAQAQMCCTADQGRRCAEKVNQMVNMMANLVVI